MGLFPQKKCAYFLRLFDSYRKKKQLCRRKFFNSSLFSLRKLNLKIQYCYKNNVRSFFFPLFFLTLSYEKKEREEQARSQKSQIKTLCSKIHLVRKFWFKIHFPANDIKREYWYITIIPWILSYYQLNFEPEGPEFKSRLRKGFPIM